MRYEQNNQISSQRRRRDWSSFLFPLTFLLIFAFTQSLAGLFTSLAIIVLLWVLIAVGSSSSQTQRTPLMQPPLMQQPTASSYEPEAERPYEQGYLGAGNTGGQDRQVMVPSSSQGYPDQPVPQDPETSGEGDRLARLQLLGDLYHAGILTQDEFTRQKKEILQDNLVKEATEPEATPMVFELEYEEQPLVSTPGVTPRNS
ncbi:MAG TPA: SHOCT domain-containing protein, partial [Ktedonobacteraceae bacterium]